MLSQQTQGKQGQANCRGNEAEHGQAGLHASILKNEGQGLALS